MKNNNLNDYIYIIGILCACLTMIFICMVASADEYQQIKDGVYQEIIPSYDDIDNESNEGSTEVYSSEFADRSEEEEKQSNEKSSTEIKENDNYDPVGEQDQEVDTSSEEEILLLTSIDDGIKKLIISLWVLFGLGLGTKLIKGLFGYG